jgi:hypothetical protein
MKQTLLPFRYLLLYASLAGFLMSLTPFSLAFLPDRHEHTDQEMQLIDAFVLLFLNIVMFYLSLWLNLVTLDKTKWHKIRLNTIAFLVLTLVAILIHQPIWGALDRLPISFFIRDEVVRNLIIFSISILVANAFHSFQQNQLMKTKIIEIQSQTLAGQIELLKQQINPHFFFNSLNTLSGLVLENSPKTVFFIENLSMVFRYLLEIQEKNLVTVAEEINFAKAYIYLLKVRFDEKFSIDILTESEHGALVPSSCTQLLLENCFKHNSMSNQQPLKIVIRSADGYLIVSNSVFQLLEVERNGIGLKNLNERSKLLTGKPIEIISNNNNFMVRVPLLKV